jgi:hypothetical protein
MFTTQVKVSTQEKLPETEQSRCPCGPNANPRTAPSCPLSTCVFWISWIRVFRFPATKFHSHTLLLLPVREREWERERERETGRESERKRERERERERESVCVWERERERECVCVCVCMRACVCACVCVCACTHYHSHKSLLLSGLEFFFLPGLEFWIVRALVYLACFLFFFKFFFFLSIACSIFTTQSQHRRTFPSLLPVPLGPPSPSPLASPLFYWRGIANMLVLSLFRIFTSGPISIATSQDTPCHPEAHILPSQSFQKKTVYYTSNLPWYNLSIVCVCVCVCVCMCVCACVRACIYMHSTSI